MTSFLPPKSHLIALCALVAVYVISMIAGEFPTKVASRVALISWLCSFATVAWATSEHLSGDDRKMFRSFLLGLGYGLMITPTVSLLAKSWFGIEKTWPVLPVVAITMGCFAAYEYLLKAK